MIEWIVPILVAAALVGLIGFLAWWELRKKASEPHPLATNVYIRDLGGGRHLVQAVGPLRAAYDAALDHDRDRCRLIAMSGSTLDADILILLAVRVAESSPMRDSRRFLVDESVRLLASGRSFRHVAQWLVHHLPAESGDIHADGSIEK